MNEKTGYGNSVAIMNEADDSRFGTRFSIFAVHCAVHVADFCGFSASRFRWRKVIIWNINSKFLQSWIFHPCTNLAEFFSYSEKICYGETTMRVVGLCSAPSLSREAASNIAQIVLHCIHLIDVNKVVVQASCVKHIHLFAAATRPRACEMFVFVCEHRCRQYLSMLCVESVSNATLQNRSEQFLKDVFLHFIAVLFTLSLCLRAKESRPHRRRSYPSSARASATATATAIAVV